MEVTSQVVASGNAMQMYSLDCLFLGIYDEVIKSLARVQDIPALCVFGNMQRSCSLILIDGSESRMEGLNIAHD